MTCYAPLDFTKDILAAAQPTQNMLSRDDMRLLQAIRSVSARLDGLFPQTPLWTMFAPYNGARPYPVMAQSVNSHNNTFHWTESLLDLQSVTLNGVALVIGTDVALYPSPTQPPFHALRLLSRQRSWYDFCPDGCSTPTPPQVVLTGVWGFHRHYAGAWLPVDSLTAAIPDTTSTAFAVNSIAGADPYQITPRISAGNLLRIDAEYLEAAQTAPTLNTGIALRGVNGSTAATHLVNAPVSVWQTEDPVQTAVARQAAMQYARRGAFTTVSVQGMTEVRYPSDWLVEVRAMLEAYSYA